MGERPRSAEGAPATGRNDIVTKGRNDIVTKGRNDIVTKGRNDIVTKGLTNTKGLGPPAVARASSAPAVIVYE